MATTNPPSASAPERDRKAEHIQLALGRRMQTGGAFDRYRLMHCALPEIDLAEVDMATSFLGKSLSASARLGWDEQDPKGDRSQLIYRSETLRARIGVDKQLSTSTNLGLSYEYTDRDSENPNTEGFGGSYTENVIALTLRVDL